MLEDWTCEHYSDAAGPPLETKRFRVHVTGPLPGKPSVSRAFVMVIRRFGDRDGWWIAPEGR